MARKRTARREREREIAKLVRQKQKLGALEVSADRPIEVESASVIEPNARSIPCVVCEGSVLIEEHAAEGGLRVVKTRCMQCGNRRDLFYRLARPS